MQEREEEALRAAVLDYVDGLYRSDVALLARVFLPQARLHAIAAGTVVDLPLLAWLDRVAARPDFKAQGVEAPYEIHTLDVASPSTAFARLTSTVPPARFLDYLTFLKVDGRWRVIDKTYHRYD
ncbi:MAG: nuclear transport factor 2 family protein [Pseudomonadota bacterium]